MSKSKNLIFFGSGDLAAKSLEFLSSHYHIGAVITKEKAPYHKDPAPVEMLANKKNIPTLFANNATQLNNLFRQLKMPLACGVVIDYGVVIDKEVIDRFPLGIINSHFSLLPEWRGADPITYSLLAGQNITGVSLMLINEGLDTGDLLAQAKLVIDPNDNNQSLSSKLINLNNDLLQKTLEKYLIGQLEPYGQNSFPATYSNKIHKSSGVIDWNKPSTVLEREIRAFKPWPGSYFVLNGIRLTVAKAEASEDLLEAGHISIVKPDIISIGCRPGSLKLLEVRPDGKNNMSVRAFINGYSSKIL